MHDCAIRPQPHQQAVRIFDLNRRIRADLGAKVQDEPIPSEVARVEYPRNWRAHMDEIRDAARHLARRRLVAITQRGRRSILTWSSADRSGSGAPEKPGAGGSRPSESPKQM